MSGEGFYPYQERADKSRPTRNTDKAYRQPQNGNAADKDNSTHLFVVRLIKSFRSESLSSMGIPLLHPLLQKLKLHSKKLTIELPCLRLNVRHKKLVLSCEADTKTFCFWNCGKCRGTTDDLFHDQAV